MTPVILWLLATIDAGASGYRAAAGRNALVRKRGYYARAIARGALAGQFVLAAGLVGAVIGAAGAADRASLHREASAFGSRLLQAYLPYAALMGLAFVVRAAPSVDLRALTSALIFGPLTFLRPVVALAGLLWAGAHVPRLAVLLVAIPVAVAMVLLERMLTGPELPPPEA